ncbi:hypothetical protein GCM10007927_41890 [Sulfitobacter pacificus]|jgi:hypothetical protein|uniref:Uncharacterized protein n=1 Tax=Sulfitobacter pacificus TaxID=1499314 RepID=A0ABQ5VQG0_9RHOB|nr:hypothetical protein GCM10007927_41890 [Sulfitobacter pacificus]VVS96400.1 hypothetical protein HOE425_100074 [Hoeflea sp. EC-HK425]
MFRLCDAERSRVQYANVDNIYGYSYDLMAGVQSTEVIPGFARPIYWGFGMLPSHQTGCPTQENRNCAMTH